MRIGIDISQLAYEGGVGEYLGSLVQNLIKLDKKNEYVLFFSSLRRSLKWNFKGNNVRVKKFKFPPSFLDLIWNRLHILPIELLVGPIDIFLTSDWTEPPSKGKKATIIYDLVVYKRSEETDRKIIEVQKRKLDWVKKESDMIFCISEATKRDAEKVLGVPANKLKVLYPGI